MSLKAKEASAPDGVVYYRQVSKKQRSGFGRQMKKVGWQRNAAEYILLLSQELITSSVAAGETGNPKRLTFLVN